MKKYLMGMAAVGVALTMSNAAKADCGEISVAEMNWASAELMANVDKLILEEGYGCSVELVPGATMTTFASMNEKGQPDVAGELWTNAVAVPLEAAVGEGRLHKVNNGPITQLGEGWWVTPWLQQITLSWLQTLMRYWHVLICSHTQKIHQRAPSLAVLLVGVVSWQTHSFTKLSTWKQKAGC